MITLPWPDKRLMPNAKNRTHWRTYHPVMQADRQAAKVLATCAIPLSLKKAIRESEGHISMTITFYPPDKRRRDDDGVVGAFKHLRDGLADAIGVDDYRFRPTYVFAEPEKPGRVEIQL